MSRRLLRPSIAEFVYIVDNPNSTYKITRHYLATLTVVANNNLTLRQFYTRVGDATIEDATTFLSVQAHYDLESDTHVIPRYICVAKLSRRLLLAYDFYRSVSYEPKHVSI